jgi:RNA polymerase sigma factor (TIGR02999 family)
MSDITQILNQIESGDPRSAEQLLPLVYDELRKLAAAKLAQEKPGQTLQATALVHEAYLRLLGSNGKAAEVTWNGRGHFFAAAAEAMRRILVEKARSRKRLKHGGGAMIHSLDEELIAEPGLKADFLAVNEALENLEQSYPQAAQIVKLRYFLGMTIPEAAEILAISPRKANQVWAFARSWLLDALSAETGF